MELEQHLVRYWSCLGFCEAEVLDFGIGMKPQQLNPYGLI